MLYLSVYIAFYPIKYISMYWCVQSGQKSVHSFIKCILSFKFISYQIYKNCLKWDPPYSMHNSQHYDTIWQVDWHYSVTLYWLQNNDEYVCGEVTSIFYEITNRCSYMQSILFHCYVHSTCFGCFIHPSSGVQFLTVSTANGTNHSIVSATYSQRGLFLCLWFRAS